MRYILTFFLSILILPLAGQITIQGIVADVNNEGINGATIYTEWIEKNQVKRKFAQTLADGSFSLVTMELPCKLAIEHTQYENIQINLKDSTFKLITLFNSGAVQTIKPLVLTTVRALNHNPSQTKIQSITNSHSKFSSGFTFVAQIPTFNKPLQPMREMVWGYSGIRIRGTDGHTNKCYSEWVFL